MIILRKYLRRQRLAIRLIILKRIVAQRAVVNLFFAAVSIAVAFLLLICLILILHVWIALQQLLIIYILAIIKNYRLGLGPRLALLQLY